MSKLHNTTAKGAAGCKGTLRYVGDANPFPSGPKSEIYQCDGCGANVELVNGRPFYGLAAPPAETISVDLFSETDNGPSEVEGV